MTSRSGARSRTYARSCTLIDGIVASHAAGSIGEPGRNRRFGRDPTTAEITPGLARQVRFVGPVKLDYLGEIGRTEAELQEIRGCQLFDTGPLEVPIIGPERCLEAKCQGQHVDVVGIALADSASRLDHRPAIRLCRIPSQGKKVKGIFEERRHRAHLLREPRTCSRTSERTTSGTANSRIEVSKNTRLAWPPSRAARIGLASTTSRLGGPEAGNQRLLGQAFGPGEPPDSIREPVEQVALDLDRDRVARRGKEESDDLATPGDEDGLGSR